MKGAVAFASGLLFALGLGIGGMTQPSKVIGFLDVAGDWDPSLALVMAGALLVYGVVARLALASRAPLLDEKFLVPTRRDIDRPLVVGAILFGAGWGLAGYCPGPALVSLASGNAAVVVFVAAMLAGMWLEQRWIARQEHLARTRAAVAASLLLLLLLLPGVGWLAAAHAPAPAPAEQRTADVREEMLASAEWLAVPGTAVAR